MPSPLRLARLLLAACAGFSCVGGCVGAAATGTAPPNAGSEPPAPATAVAPGEPPTLLLAVHMQPPGPGDRDYILPVRGVVHLLFSRPIDPLSVGPQHFVLVLGNGHRVIPVGVFLGAGVEPGEARSLALMLAEPAKAEPPKSAAATGNPASPPAEPPSDPISVTITGLLHDADGRVLEGLALDVAPAARPVFPVRAEPATGLTCAGFEQALRVFWSAPVHRPESAPSPLVGRSDGTRRPAEGVDDDDDPAADGVLDFCLRGPAAATGIELPAGAAVDLRGAPTAAGVLQVSPVP